MARLSTPELLREVLRDRHGDETLERSLGRVLRRHGLGYDVYTAVVEEVRAVARRRHLDPWAAAREIRDRPPDPR